MIREDLKFTTAGDFVNMQKESIMSQQIQELKDFLNEGVVLISFEKKDGSIRKMNATTNIDNIPDEHLPKGESDRNYSDEVQRVFDVDLSEWRSFRWDSLRTYQINLPFNT